MAQEIEQENTYLLHELPSALISDWKKEYTKDTYFPPTSPNPQIRLRQRGNGYVLTKKYPLDEKDLSTMVEETIKLTYVEYEFLYKNLTGHSIAKNRYSKDYGEYTIEVDEYLDELSPLIVLDIEWKANRGDYEKIIKQFNPVKEITNSGALAAGQIAGKTYEEIKKHL